VDFTLDNGVQVAGRLYLEDTFDIDYSDPIIFRWFVLLILIGFFTAFFLIAFLSLKYLSFGTGAGQVSSVFRYFNLTCASDSVCCSKRKQRQGVS